MKIFIDDSGGFSWTPHGVSLFCAVTVSDRTFDGIASNFSSWKTRQPYSTSGAELKGTDLSPQQQASFVNSVILNSTDLRLTLAGTKTTLFRKEIAEQYIKDAASILRAVAKSGHDTDRPLIEDFFRRMARWMDERSPENLMWIICLGDAIRLAIQHAIVQFAYPADDSEFDNIEVLIDQSFIGKSTHIDFWREWLRNFLYSQSRKEPTMIPKTMAGAGPPIQQKIWACAGNHCLDRPLQKSCSFREIKRHAGSSDCGHLREHRVQVLRWQSKVQALQPAALEN